MDNSEQQQRDRQERVREQAEKLKRPLYRIFIRDKIPIKTEYETITVTHPKSVWKEPLVHLFFAVNSVWGLFCLNIVPIRYHESIFVAIPKLIGVIWMMGLPAAVVYIRETSKAEEPFRAEALFVLTIQLSLLGFFGGLLLFLLLGVCWKSGANYLNEYFTLR